MSKKDRAAEAAAATAFEAASSASVAMVLSSRFALWLSFPWIDNDMDGGDKRALVRTSIAAVLRLVWGFGAAAAVVSTMPFCSSMVYLDEKVGFFALLYLIADAPFELDQASQQKNQRDGNAMEIAKEVAMEYHSIVVRQYPMSMSIPMSIPIATLD